MRGRRPNAILVKKFKEFIADPIPGFKPTIAALCPFCVEKGKKNMYVAGFSGTNAAGERVEDGEPALYHDSPECSQYRDLEPDEFMKAARLKMSD